MAKYPKDLLTLIAHLKKFPGVGKKTAERFAFSLLYWEEQELGELATLLASLRQRIQSCAECGCLMETTCCHFCDSKKRDTSTMCLIAYARDVYAIEETGMFNGLYHVLGTLLSPLDGKMPENLNLPLLKKRITRFGVQEIILALDSTLEGDATALFLREQLKKEGLKVSRLALGIPLGSSLDFVDEGTLSQALSGRKSF
jgi:recombination protein RecR